MKTDQELFQQLFALVEFMGMKIRFKDESKFMKFLGFLLFFNKNFMTTYTTTIGSTVWFPSREFVKARPDVWKILCHEAVHYEDAKKYKIGFYLWYLFPQVLTPLALLAVFNLWFLLFLVCLLPLPAPGRKWAEMRGYAMTLAVEYWRSHQRLAGPPDQIVKQFTGMSYYLMWPFKTAVKRELTLWINRSVDGRINHYIPLAARFRLLIW